MFNSLSIANYFLSLSFKEGNLVSPMKLVKLVYIAHGWHLGLTSRPLIKETTEAWMYGPVVPVIYRAFKPYGNKPIKRLYFESPEVIGDYNRINHSNGLPDFLTEVWNKYKTFSATQLSDLTHQMNTPWFDTWHKNHGAIRSGAVIPNDSIMEHYKVKALKDTKDYERA